MSKFISKLFLILIFYFVSITTLPLFLVSLVFLFIFKKMLELYLKIKYGKQFGGMVESSDSLWLEGTPHKNAIDSVLIIQKDSLNPIDISEDLKRVLKKIILKNAKEIPKLSSTVNTCCGFGFLLRKYIDIDECVSTITVERDTENYFKSFEDILGEICNKEFPYDNKFLWKIFIVTGPTEWKLRQNITENQVYVCTRIHHIFADGVSLFKNFTGLYSSGMEEAAETFQNNLSRIDKKENSFVKLLQSIHYFILVPGFLTFIQFEKKTSHPYYQNKKIVGDSRYFLKIDTDKTLLNCIKRIKKTIGDASFTDVLFTSITASFERYFSNNYKSIPDLATIAVPVIIDIKDASNTKTISFKNSFGILIVPLPILFNGSLSERLTEVKKRTKEEFKSLNFKILHIFMKYIIGVMPINLSKYLFDMEGFDICLSNLPGYTTKIRLPNGIEVEHLIFFPPIRGTVGATTALMTYNNQVHFSLVVNDKVMTNKVDCQSIVEDVFKCIRSLDKELRMEKSAIK